MIKLTSERFLNGVQDCLITELIHAAMSRELINTWDMRGIGKTTSLVKFAKKFNLSVVVKNSLMAHALKSESGYDNIFALSELRSTKNKNVVIDEGVDRTTVEEMGYTVITGFSDLR